MPKDITTFPIALLQAMMLLFWQLHFKTLKSVSNRSGSQKEDHLPANGTDRANMQFLKNWTYYLSFIVIIFLVSYVLNYLDHYFQKDLSIVVRNSTNDTALYKKVNPFKFRNININSKSSSNKTKNILEKSLPTKKDTHKYYTLQVGSFRNRKDAQSQAQRYNKLGYKTIISKVDLSEKGIWYRIFIGNFETRQKALTYAEHLSRKLEIENPWVHAVDKH